MSKKIKSLRSICLAVQDDSSDVTFNCIYDDSKPFFVRIFLVLQFILKRFFQKTKFAIDYICYDVQNQQILSSKKLFSRSLPQEFFYEQNSLYYIMEYINGVEISEYLLTERSKPVIYEFIIVHSINKPININKFRFSDIWSGIKENLLTSKYGFPLVLISVFFLSMFLVIFINSFSVKNVSNKSFSFKISTTTVHCKYQGQWLKKAPNGQGELTFSEDVSGYWKKGDKIIGEFENGFLNGDGVFISSDGSEYNGDFINNMLNGVGTFTFPNNEKLVAEFKNNVANGQGVYNFSNGDIFEGTYVDGEPNGFGTYRFSDGGLYEGFFKYGKENGYGKYTFPSGDYYEGEYKDGLWNGVGILRSADGTIIENGEWRNNKILYSAMPTDN